MDSFLDIAELSLTKTGEELCGDQVRTLNVGDRTIIVLSDGLGSGVKASILSSLTSSIIATLGRSEVPLHEMIKTVIGTLPICKVRKVAYATFTILEIERSTGKFRIVNFDNPPSFFFRDGHNVDLQIRTETILGREIKFSNGQLQRGDFVGLVSDGVLYAGLGVVMDFGWGRENIAKFLESLFLRHARTSQQIISAAVAETRRLYQDRIGDDATFVGVYARERNALMVLTGPPLKTEDDEEFVAKLFDFRGRRVVCGGTTANIVSASLGVEIETNIETMRPDVPPTGTLPDVDLVTEGIFTMAKALELMRNARGEAARITDDNNGAALLAKELLYTDSINFVVGQSINEWYQNPLLPKSISIRRQLVEEIATFLLTLKKEVKLEYC
ncbi:MAG: SpoIIE family protein phosphatase [Capsulimonadaceae bacterium]|nr:SpoIIE family protein phosphatase [Capsulimonadaceae bacterium]